MKSLATPGKLVQTLALTTLIALSGCTRALQCDSKAPAEANDPTAKIISALADYKTFRMNSSQIDRLVGTHCKRTSLKVVDESTLAKYACSEASGIREIKIDSHESGPNHYLRYAVVFFDAKRFARTRSIFQKQLGKPEKTGKDFSRWTYYADKQLNSKGIPSIMVMLSDDGADGIFQLGLEQGP